jgi:tyrosinase
LPEFFTEPAKEANTSFTAEVIDALVSGYVGDYKGFQTAMEAFEGPHGAVHEILGGFVFFLDLCVGESSDTRQSRDLAGYCPEDASESCFDNEPSPTFSANEPLFWMHHAVSLSPLFE